MWLLAPCCSVDHDTLFSHTAPFHSITFTEDDSVFKPEKDRYHLYVAAACPWAHRTLMVRALKGLGDCISVTAVHPTWKKTRPNDANDSHNGWFFADPKGEPLRNTLGLGGPFPAHFDGCEPDPIHGFKYVRDIYEYVGDTTGTRSVPILWDKKTDTIVSNESSEIIRMLSSEFNEFATNNVELDLYAPEDRAAIDAVNDWVYPTINNGVYRCGFAKSQQAYDIAIDELTKSFDRIDTILQRQKFIAGDHLTEADIRLFATLFRFDEIYVVYFKTNTRSVATTPAMMDYCRRIYNMPGIAETCNMEQIKFHYYTSHPSLNQWSIIPRGSNFVSLLKEEHAASNGNKKQKLCE